ncbi:uncharacterized protein PHALS_11799 [Plasmopara halstedii]|uniref:Uncharacterized protein n=1 Tax=Plasmopara halstedii TaxID=4781 RepID=A0A0P1AK37_PLAHL|nr:uncharacterized protein PHALS_11799 [Plasmopara halstedii]CEG41454.1 hypothetical protein PHALS_11799 [Plasmopara halstedii]|eukprot:XP_024577823.1 hypothetical protein PHALS_11799 [Plasmopara halstedii]
MQQSKFLRAIEAFIKFQAAKGGTARSLAISVKDEAECQVLLCAIIDFIYRKFDNCCTIRLVFTNACHDDSSRKYIIAASPESPHDNKLDCNSYFGLIAYLVERMRHRTG